MVDLPVLQRQFDEGMRVTTRFGMLFFKNTAERGRGLENAYDAIARC